MIVLTNWTEFKFTQDCFVRFANHFKNLTISQLNDDKQLFAYHKNLLEKEPELTRYAYQFAFESVYNKRLFSQNALQEAFTNKFCIIDPYGLNNGFCTIGDLNSAFIINHIKRKTIFEASNIVLNTTPIEYQTKTYEKIQKNMQNKIDNNRICTGNTNPDLEIDNRPYDVKHTLHNSVNLNHVLPWTYEKFENNFVQHLKNTQKHIEITINKNPRNIEFFRKANKKILDIIHDKNKTLTQKNNDWHEFIHTNSSNIPPNFNYSLVFQMTEKPYVIATPKYITEKTQISSDVLENNYKAKLAISGVVHILGRSTVEKAKIATLGGIFFDESSSVE